DFYRVEVLLTHARALEAADVDGAAEVVAGAVQWVTAAAEECVPLEHRAGFLGWNPVNRTLFEVARRLGVWEGETPAVPGAPPVEAPAESGLRPPITL
ncbi:MAG TPA: hypothetical protein VNT60_02310, partial [Deinococcales bacterium]|nr:hypothetical protein [Deinococcales bacterium]